MRLKSTAMCEVHSNSNNFPAVGTKPVGSISLSPLREESQEESQLSPEIAMFPMNCEDDFDGRR